MENKENNEKLLNCMIKGPGPKYKLRTLVGYEEHCLSRKRGPAYTIRPRTELHMRSIGPGPQYNVSKLTKYGVDKPPAYTIAPREPFRLRDSGPGPGAHYPELCLPMNHDVRPPAYTIKSRTKKGLSDSGPGPNVYILPSCIGPKIPDKEAQGAFSISGPHKIRQEDVGPGPAAYTNIRTDLIKHSSPAFSLKWRYHRIDTDVSPMPYFPQYNKGRRAPTYSFGIKHSECAGIPITELDED
ncbi:ciliary microtubule associated protein 1B-like [Osmia lignaria lignaria]|uniref:ciliary microtubule associated protein 1B-like n=1 Tax=Osmia lignaria lignaria TaxID=1437193 RepID=UPI001478E6C3|nr:outer dense fiber protein 3-like [Osmia lignaria]